MEGQTAGQSDGRIETAPAGDNDQLLEIDQCWTELPNNTHTSN